MTVAAVRDQYEQHPYPRWLSPPRESDELRAAVPSPPRLVLAAGCGTGRDACSVALTYPDSWVVGVDVSEASLREAVDQARRYRIRNVSFRRFDLLRLDRRFVGRFDLVVAVGVLHHLDAPERGIGVLADLLPPGGHLLLGLYSRVGRREIIRAREIAVRHGYSADDLERFVRDAPAILPAETYTALARYPDFQYEAGVRDLLFPARETYLDLPELDVALRRARLDVREMLVRPGIAAAFEAAEIGDRRDLHAWQTFESRHPDTFRAMYRLVCQRKSARTVE